MTDQDRRNPREARITAAECAREATLHDHLQAALGLPKHYGRNLSALADCLSETSRPILITLAVEEDALSADMRAYLLRFAQVCAREALRNENVSLIIEHP